MPSIILKNKKIPIQKNIFAITFKPADADKQIVLIINGEHEHQVYQGDPETAWKIYGDICNAIEAKVAIDLTKVIT